MHQSGFVSYDCKNESSSHQLKYFIFTDLTLLWFSLHVVYVSPSLTLSSTQAWKTTATTFRVQNLGGVQPWKKITCVGALPSSVPAIPSTSQPLTRRHFYHSPTLATPPWPHKASCALPTRDTRDLQPHSIGSHSKPIHVHEHKCASSSAVPSRRLASRRRRQWAGINIAHCPWLSMQRRGSGAEAFTMTHQPSTLTPQGRAGEWFPWTVTGRRNWLDGGSEHREQGGKRWGIRVESLCKTGGKRGFSIFFFCLTWREENEGEQERKGQLHSLSGSLYVLYWTERSL